MCEEGNETLYIFGWCYATGTLKPLLSLHPELSVLVLKHIHKHVSLNSEDIFDDFAASGSRRMELSF